MNKMVRRFGVLGAFGLAIMAGATSASAKEHKQAAELPHCARPIGTAAVRVPPGSQDWWSGIQLASPEAVVKALVQESGCFTLLDRGIAMQMADEELARAENGTLRAGSNIHRGQARAADYIIVPTLLTANPQARSNNIGGIIGGIGGIFHGAIGTIANVAGLVNTNKKTADVQLEIVNVRTRESIPFSGHASKHDLGIGGGTDLWSGSTLGSFGASSYSDTDIGKVIMAAYADAYAKLVVRFNGGPVQVATAVTQPSATHNAGTATTTRPSILRDSPKPSGKLIVTLPPGALLYPTGERSESGAWMRVRDEENNLGWVSSASVQPN